jgi:hypothetical protein
MAGIKYVFREDEPLRIKAAGKADPQVIGEALEKIANEVENEELRPKAVVDAARNKKHPLHPHFEWDDSVAAEAYRVDQARSLIRIVRVISEETQDGTERAFISVKQDSGTSYRHVTAVRSSLELQLAVLKRAQADLEAFEKRYREFADVCDLVRSAREKLADRQNKFETRAAA